MKLIKKTCLTGILLSFITYNAHTALGSQTLSDALSLTFGTAIMQKNSCLENIYKGNFEKDRILLALYYKQPNHFFRIPGTRNIILGLYPAPNTLTQIYFAGLSQIIPIIQFRNFYLNCELGLTYNSDITSKLGSRLNLLNSIELGVTFKKYNIGLIRTHFSNANLTSPNVGENFFGIVFGMKF